ncbi:Peptidoglycan D,D-transpeptidase MrdA [Fundidesulfovibrio magnetotacticus]|uniref:Peptidoglycan D,D-transpeptidase MrdA n=1 Tax=Fundidesulfovibrio magnetotacticus TaxID=2730080 RepID=A0A6V8LYB7_9BACT|nr:penicillin-binding protein 2 [Fundidesulfovibrio magnetotacticus]GFK95228.1 Peptidoglycan D,D-transpeptidase MrdA [Fundidesulfovibrio magnetotacticus]
MPKTYESDSGQQTPRGGLILLQALVLGLFCLFTLRLWYLQVHRGEHFSDLARENQMRQASIIAARGMILDRNGKALAVNEPSFALGLIREDCEDVQGTLRKVAEWTGLDYQVLLDTYIRGKKRSKPFEPLVLISNLSYELLAKIEANAVSWPGLEILIRHKRYYPDGMLMAHVLGYVAEANEEDLEKDSRLALGDHVGKQGLEYVLEQRLRGEKGLKQIEVDAYGREHDQHVLLEPRAGGNLKLSIDAGLQAWAAKQLEGQAGAIAVLEADTGKVAALVSQPSYDSNLFVLGIPPKKWKELRDDPMHPIQNRVAQSVYPPGSTFKLLMAAAALSEGLIKTTDTVFCSGSYRVGDHDFHCWKKGGHGSVDMRSALVHSCDVYFYQLGERLGIDRINRYALQAGFGAPTGIDLPHERGGLIPSTAWKKRRYGENWTRGETLNASIGQGSVQVSPLQLAKFVASLVNGGRIIRPSLVLDDPVDVQAKLNLSDKDREFIVRAMADTVQAGTAQKLKRPDAVIGGKTGTAQVVRLANADIRQKTHEMAYKQRDHAWIATWGQKDGKTYVVVCMVEHGGHGGETAGPIVRSIYDYLFGPAPGMPKAQKAAEAARPEVGD